MPQSLLERGLSPKAMLLGLFAGANAALPMYLWQSNAQLAVACLIVVGYTVWLWAATAGEIASNMHMRQDLRLLPMNSCPRRIGRMVADGGFWWSICFGCTIVSGSAWYVGITRPDTLIGIGAAWSLVAVLLNYGLTLEHPTTRCRRCFYQLRSHFDRAAQHEKVRCPECGAHWSRADLGLIPVDALRANNKQRGKKSSRKARKSRKTQIVQLNPTLRHNGLVKQ